MFQRLLHLVVTDLILFLKKEAKPCHKVKVMADFKILT